MSAWYESELLVYDCESTGVSVESDRIVTATTAVVGPSGITEVRTWLLNPGVDIPAEATAVHGVTTARAAEEGRDPGVTLPEIRDRLVNAWAVGMPVVAFNAPFDLTILDRELRRYNRSPLLQTGPVLDPLVIDKWAEPYRRGSRKLADLCALYGVRHGGAHDATEDALAAGRLMWAMVRGALGRAGLEGAVAGRYAGLRSMSLAELHVSQVGWKAAQQRDLRRHWESRGDPRASEVDESWPMRPYRPARAPQGVAQ